MGYHTIKLFPLIKQYRKSKHNFFTFKHSYIHHKFIHTLIF